LFNSILEASTTNRTAVNDLQPHWFVGNLFHVGPNSRCSVGSRLRVTGLKAAKARNLASTPDRSTEIFLRFQTNSTTHRTNCPVGPGDAFTDSEAVGAWSCRFAHQPVPQLRMRCAVPPFLLTRYSHLYLNWHTPNSAVENFVYRLSSRVTSMFHKLKKLDAVNTDLCMTYWWRRFVPDPTTLQHTQIDTYVWISTVLLTIITQYTFCSGTFVTTASIHGSECSSFQSRLWRTKLSVTINKQRDIGKYLNC
jgi:hypothetical protein